MPRPDAEITEFEKSGAPLTKRIALRAFAWRVKIDNMPALADLTNNFTPRDALGRLKNGWEDRVRVDLGPAS